MNDFFSFKTMITTIIIKILYIIGAVIITLASLYGIMQSAGNHYGGGGLMALYALLLLIFGNVFWRMFCEGAIILFSIHENLVQINHNTRQGMSTVSSEKKCSKCGKLSASGVAFCEDCGNKF